MNLQHLPQRRLIPTRQIPRHGNPQLRSRFKNQQITLVQLLSRKPAAQKIVDMRIGAGLVQDHVTPFYASHQAGDRR